MNIATRQLSPASEPSAAIGRRKWTADEVLAMCKAGIIGKSDRYQLIDGDIVTMAAKGARHEIVRSELMLYWAKRLDDIKLASESPLRFGPRDEPEPDLMLFPATMRVLDVRGDSVLLLVEVADWSRSYDLKVKSLYYAAHGVREYWEIDAEKSLVTTVHTRPSEQGYGRVVEVPPTTLSTPSLAPSLAVRLAELDLGIEVST